MPTAIQLEYIEPSTQGSEGDTTLQVVGRHRLRWTSMAPSIVSPRRQLAGYRHSLRRLPRTWATVCAFAFVTATSAIAADMPGVTSTEIKVGGMFPFSGPASSLSSNGRAVSAYVKSINDRGGVNGRKINYIAYDDAYSPPKSVEQARKLVESDEIAFMFGQLGTPGNAAIAKYLHTKGVPSIAIISGSSKFTNVSNFPLTTTGIVSFETEGKIYAKYFTKTLPNAKYAILYQNDDLGKDYLNAFKQFFRDDFDKKVVALSYELADPSVESQIVSLKNSGAAALLVAGTPKFAAQTIRKAHELNWNPLIILNFPSGSVGATLKPAGLDISTGVIVGTMMKDPNDPRWDQDEGMKNFKTFVGTYLPGVDISDHNYLYGYSQGMLLELLLKQCGNDLSRENVIKQAKDLRDVQLAMVLPGIKISTSDKVNMGFTQLRLQRWTGTHWDMFSEVLDATSE